VGASYRSLDAEAVALSIERLTSWIDARFEGSGLSGVARELLAVNRGVRRRASSPIPG
jgi:hypothetical protein